MLSRGLIGAYRRRITLPFKLSPGREPYHPRAILPPVAPRVEWVNALDLQVLRAPDIHHAASFQVDREYTLEGGDSTSPEPEREFDHGPFWLLSNVLWGFPARRHPRTPCRTEPFASMGSFSRWNVAYGIILTRRIPGSSQKRRKDRNCG